MPTPIDYLLSAQHESGGWGYQSGHKPVVEPTAAVILALRDNSTANSSIQRGIDWLLSCQNPDGGWGINENDHESGWHTSWALMALLSISQGEKQISSGVQWLTTVATLDVPKEQFLNGQVPKTSTVGALAWPWLPGQVCWIEPTALALLALQRNSASLLAIARINAALEYFRQFRTPSGGWNVGNAGPLDTIIIPRAYPTSLVLMALALHSDQDIQPSDLAALQQDLLRDAGNLAHASALLAMRILSKNNSSEMTYLSTTQLPDGSWEHNPFVTAWAMIAMRGYL
jgi:hypothetical protein